MAASSLLPFVRPFAFAGLVLVLTFACARTAQADANQIIEDTGTLFTYLLDTETSFSSPLLPQAVSAKEGWTVLAQDDTEHVFNGDAVLLNDRLAVVLRKAGAGAEVYVKGESGYSRRAELIPQGEDGAPLAGDHTVNIGENSPGAVMVEARYALADGTTSPISYRLVTGQVYVQVQSALGAVSLAVRLASDYLIVPDFFADDLVYRPQDFFSSRTGLPAENFLMHLVGDGDALVTCVWKSRRQRATAVAALDSPTLRIEGCDITFEDQAPIWVAFLEREDVWHTFDIPGGQSAEDQVLDWKAPFPARWRADFVTSSEASMSWNFEEGRVDSYTAPGLGDIVYRCWFQGDSAYVHRPAEKQGQPARVVVYPIDRIQGTPLNIFCLVDIMRGTLGVGACQYILDLEGLDAETSPTPALVMDWVEKQFKAGRAEKAQGQIEERLSAMVAHVSQAHERIQAYAEFARQLREQLEQASGSASAAADKEALSRIADIADEMLDAVNAYHTLLSPSEAAEEKAAAVLHLIGQDDAYEKCQVINEELHRLGAAQDRALSKGRMAVRRIDQQAMDLMAAKSPESAFARDVHEQTMAFLQDTK